MEQPPFEIGDGPKSLHFQAVAREQSSGWGGGGAQLTFASVIHDRKKPYLGYPEIPQNNRF